MKTGLCRSSKEQQKDEWMKKEIILVEQIIQRLVRSFELMYSDYKNFR